MTWTSEKIRQQFLSFFEQKEHQIVPSAPMVLKNDPTLMFTNAGMNQFKDVFLGNAAASSSRVADSQKCLRVSGKHNDLEEVGVDTYHHTMFEMLGNWSFGDYFKKEAIEWAWELLVDVYGINKDDLYVTVYGGDEEDGLGKDMEAYDYWRAILPEDRILFFGKKDNFWEMGETGPSGPCSEIHIDVRDAEERKTEDARNLVNADHPRVIELWNLVFIEYNRLASRKLEPLPNKHIDTGMGFERLAVVLQGKQSNYDSDVFKASIELIEKKAGVKYTSSDSQTDIAIRVIVDHVRAIAFAIADGQLPSNNKAGYVIRRILRRAMRYGFSFLDLKEPFLCDLVPVLVQQMGAHFPELKKQSELVIKVVREEEESFLRTLDKGIVRIEKLIEETEGKIVDGKKAFELYDRYGFPIDLTRLMLSEHNLTLNEAQFQSELQKQKDKSKGDAETETDDWVEVAQGEQTQFLGYDQLDAEIKILRYRKVMVKGATRYQLVFDQTPFYAEGGGQVGDTGYIENSGERVSIVNTLKENTLVIHITSELPKDPLLSFNAVVNSEKRTKTENNHTATHLLHEALREVLGTHVEQKGSLVGPEYLRFDFSHFSKVTEEELETIEKLVNDRIRKNLALEEMRETPMDKAIEMGAMALFGEKYGDAVRVIKFGNSVELCGGTHVASTGRIGFLHVRSEGATSAGIRRIEAITAETAEAFLNKQLDELKALKQLLKQPKDTAKALTSLLDENQQLQKELDGLKKEKVVKIKDLLLTRVETKNGINRLITKVELDANSTRELAFMLKKELNQLFLVLGNVDAGKVGLTVVVSEELVKEKSLDASSIVRELAKEIKGGGGGQAFFATAGGKNPAGIDSALEKAESYLN